MIRLSVSLVLMTSLIVNWIGVSVQAPNPWVPIKNPAVIEKYANICEEHYKKYRSIPEVKRTVLDAAEWFPLERHPTGTIRMVITFTDIKSHTEEETRYFLTKRGKITDFDIPYNKN